MYTTYSDSDSFFWIWFWVWITIDALLALIPANIAREKGRSAGAFWALSFFATIFVGLLAVIAVSKRDPLLDPADQDGGENGPYSLPVILQCPYCAENIKAQAKICKHCGKSVEEQFLNELERRKAANDKQIEEQKRLEQMEFRKVAEHFKELEEQRKQRHTRNIKWAKSPLGISIISILSIALIATTASSIVNLQASQLAAEEKEKAVAEKAKAAEEKAQAAKRAKSLELENINDRKVEYVKEVIAACTYDGVISNSISVLQIDLWYEDGASCIQDSLDSAGIRWKHDGYAWRFIIKLEDMKL